MDSDLSNNPGAGSPNEQGTSPGSSGPNNPLDTSAPVIPLTPDAPWTPPQSSSQPNSETGLNTQELLKKIITPGGRDGNNTSPSGELPSDPPKTSTKPTSPPKNSFSQTPKTKKKQPSTPAWNPGWTNSSLGSFSPENAYVNPNPPPSSTRPSNKRSTSGSGNQSLKFNRT